MSIFGWLAIGLFGGLLTHRLSPHEGPSVDIAFGIVGALVGGFVFTHAVRAAPLPAFNVASLLAALIGAAVVLMLQRMLVRTPTP